MKVSSHSEYECYMFNSINSMYQSGYEDAMGHAVRHLGEALSYKVEGCGVD